MTSVHESTRGLGERIKDFYANPYHNSLDPWKFSTQFWWSMRWATIVVPAATLFIGSWIMVDHWWSWLSAVAIMVGGIAALIGMICLGVDGAEKEKAMWVFWACTAAGLAIAYGAFCFAYAAGPFTTPLF